jgi:hypothetical protein
MQDKVWDHISRKDFRYHRFSVIISSVRPFWHHFETDRFPWTILLSSDNLLTHDIFPIIPQFSESSNSTEIVCSSCRSRKRQSQQTYSSGLVSLVYGSWGHLPALTYNIKKVVFIIGAKRAQVKVRLLVLSFYAMGRFYPKYFLPRNSWVQVPSRTLCIISAIQSSIFSFHRLIDDDIYHELLKNPTIEIYQKGCIVE